MKVKFLAVLIFAGIAFGQPPHSVTLTWTDTANPAGVTYNVYRSSGACTSSAAFVQVATVNVSAIGATPKTYTDPSIPPGTYCFRVTAVVGGSESAPSNLAPAVVGAFPPAGLAVVVQ